MMIHLLRIGQGDASQLTSPHSMFIIRPACKNCINSVRGNDIEERSDECSENDIHGLYDVYGCRGRMC